MTKKKVKKYNKKRQPEYEKKLKIEGSFEDAIKALVKEEKKDKN